jgi:hypothetical protein
MTNNFRQAYDNYFVARLSQYICSHCSFGEVINTDYFRHVLLDVVGPDPFAAVVAPNDNTASVRLFQHYDPSDWVIVQDHREYTIVGVFSSLGGIWTIVNGVFALIFGGSMLIVLGSFFCSILAKLSG